MWAPLLALAEEHPRITYVPVTREGEAFALASGLWLGGRAPVVCVQNCGLLESGDSLRGVAVRMGVPLLILVTYRGLSTIRAAGFDPLETDLTPRLLTRPDVDSGALLTEPTLRAWGIPYRFYGSDADAPLVAEAWAQAERDAHPMALLITQALS
jgi:sulfopyruvate decarboxylase TPP-binding subunit